MWTEEKDHLKASFKFKGFPEAMAFMMEVAFACEKADHHPDWRNVWNRVDITLSTHSAGNTVTEKDHALAKVIDKIFEATKKQN